MEFKWQQRNDKCARKIVSARSEKQQQQNNNKIKQKYLCSISGVCVCAPHTMSEGFEHTISNKIHYKHIN